MLAPGDASITSMARPDVAQITAAAAAPTDDAVQSSSVNATRHGSTWFVPLGPPPQDCWQQSSRPRVSSPLTLSTLRCCRRHHQISVSSVPPLPRLHLGSAGKRSHPATSSFLQTRLCDKSTAAGTPPRCSSHEQKILHWFQGANGRASPPPRVELVWLSWLS